MVILISCLVSFCEIWIDRWRMRFECGKIVQEKLLELELATKLGTCLACMEL